MVTGMTPRSLTAYPRHTPSAARGFSMIEVLVTLIIVTVGLLGLAGLQSRLQVSEIEAYQRAQALILLDDMASRIATNRLNAAAYASATTYGAGMTCPTAVATTRERDLRDWCLALQGASETLAGASVGAMVGGRGCIQALAGGQYLVTVAWQGLTPIAAPAPTCGQNQYDTNNTACVNDLCRRVVTTIVRIGGLT